MIYYGEIEYTSGYLGCQDVKERERVTVELRGTVGPYINNWLILHLVTGAGFVLSTGIRFQLLLLRSPFRFFFWNSIPAPALLRVGTARLLTQLFRRWPLVTMTLPVSSP